MPEEKYIADFNYFINNNVGKLIAVKSGSLFAARLDRWLIVEYENIPEKIKEWFIVDIIAEEYGDSTRSFEIEELIYSSPNKIDCELFLSMKNFNL